MMMTTVMMQQRESKPHQSLSPLSSFIYIQSAISVLFLHHHPHHQHHHHHHHHQDIAVRVMKSMHIFKLPQLMKTMWKKYSSNIWFQLIFKSAISFQYAKLIWSQINLHIFVQNFKSFLINDE